MKLKPLSKSALPKALERAIHYRLLNEPWQAESICKDILNAEPDNQSAIRTLILAITDKFESTENSGVPELRELVLRLEDEYEQYYYKGIIAERLGKSILSRATPRVRYIAHDHIQEAMRCYEKAESLAHDKQNEDSRLRWNACIRMIDEFNLQPAPESEPERPFME